MRPLSLVRTTLAIAIMTGGVAMAGSPPDAASTTHVQHAWIRLLPAGLPAGGYAVISNTGDAPHTVTSASSTDYASVMLHHSSEKNGVSQMRMVKALTIPAHGKLTLAPGGYHLMFMHATGAVHAGDKVTVTLHFADGSKLKADFTAMPANSNGPSQGG